MWRRMLVEQQVQAIKAETKSIWETYIEQGRPVMLRNQIFMLNMGLVRQTLKKVIGTSPLDEDFLLSAGWEGLIKAIENFDPTLGNCFSSYACLKIKGAMQHAIRDHRPDLYKIPQQWREHISAIRRMHRELLKVFPAATEVDAAQHLGYTAEYYEMIKQGTKRNPTKDIDDCEFYSHDGINPLEYQQQQYQQQVVQRAIAALPKHLRVIFVANWMQGLNARQIAKAHELTVTEVSIRIEKALGILRKTLEAQGIGIDA